MSPKQTEIERYTNKSTAPLYVSSCQRRSKLYTDLMVPLGEPILSASVAVTLVTVKSTVWNRSMVALRAETMIGACLFLITFTCKYVIQWLIMRYWVRINLPVLLNQSSAFNVFGKSQMDTWRSYFVPLSQKLDHPSRGLTPAQSLQRCPEVWSPARKLNHSLWLWTRLASWSGHVPSLRYHRGFHYPNQ